MKWDEKELQKTKRKGFLSGVISKSSIDLFQTLIPDPSCPLLLTGILCLNMKLNMIIVSAVILLVVYSSAAAHGGNQSDNSISPVQTSNNGTSDTEITFWTPLTQYYEKVSSLVMSNIPKNLLAMKQLFGYNIISLAILAASLFISFVFSPNSWLNKLSQINLGSGVEELARRVDLAIHSYDNIDPEVCIRMAACTLGKQKKSMSQAGSRPQHHPLLGGIQVLDNLLRFVVLFTSDIRSLMRLLTFIQSLHTQTML